MTDELQKALYEAEKSYSKMYQEYFYKEAGGAIVIINKQWESFATLALAELERKDERIKELENKLEAIRGALMTDEEIHKYYMLHICDGEDVTKEQRNRIQKILEK